MKLVVLGSGTSIIKEKRKGPAFLIDTGKQLLLLDCGWGAGLQAIKAGYKLENIDHFFITHPHGDHIGNLIPLIQSIYVSGIYFPKTQRKKPVFLHGYKGLKKDYTALKNMMMPGVRENYDIIFFEYLNSKKNIQEICISSLKNKHRPEFFNSVSFRISIGKKSIFYTGDTGYYEKLAILAKNADVGIFEQGVSPDQYKIQGAQPGHLSSYEAGILAQKAKVKTLVLSHLYDDFKISDVVSGAKQNYKGRIIIAKDLQKIYF